MDAHDVRNFARAYASAILTGDEVAAEQVVRQAIEADFSTSQIDDEIIAPALWLVGDLWERGEISVAEEHLATEISLRVLALQREARRAMQERPERTVMLATTPGELHTVALRMVGGLLREAGYRTRMVGGDVPARDLATLAQRHAPDVVCLSTTMPGGGDRVLIAIHEVQKELPRAGFVVGGRGLTSRLRSRPGLEVCGRVSEAVDAVDALIQHAHLN